MKVALKNIDQNSLTELLELMRRIQSEIETFSHVSEHLPKGLTDRIDAFQEKLGNEYESRENEA